MLLGRLPAPLLWADLLAQSLLKAGWKQSILLFNRTTTSYHSTALNIVPSTVPIWIHWRIVTPLWQLLLCSFCSWRDQSIKRLNKSPRTQQLCDSVSTWTQSYSIAHVSKHDTASHPPIWPFSCHLSPSLTFHQPSYPPSYSESPSLVVGEYDTTSALKELIVSWVRHTYRHIINFRAGYQVCWERNQAP